MGTLDVARDAPQGALPLRSTHDIIAGLPAEDAVAALTQITAALAALNAAEAITLEERYDHIGLLDAQVVARTPEVLREYLTTTRHTRQRESDLWHSVHDCWRELTNAYLQGLRRYAKNSANAAAQRGFYKLARVSATRATRALRRQLQWLRVRYVVPGEALWNALAELLVFVEPQDIQEEILVYADEHTSFERELLKTLTLAVLTNDNLTPAEHDFATHIVARYARAFVLSKTPAAGCTHYFDLKHPQAPVVIGEAPPAGADVRYFGVGVNTVAALAAVLHTLEQTKQVPPELGFTTPIDPAFLTPVLTQIYHDWSGKSLERRHAREKTSARVSVAPGFKALIHVLEHAVTDPLDFTARQTQESWVVSDISADGFGVVMPAVVGDWVSVGTVIGVENEIAGAWSAGMVRRVRRLDDGQQHIGVQVLCRNAHAVRVMREASSANMRITQRMPVDHGILLSADAATRKEVELLVSDASLYGADTVHVLVGEHVLVVRLREVLEVTADCARLNLMVLSVES